VGFLIAILTLALVGVVVLVVGAPLRRASRTGDSTLAAASSPSSVDGSAAPMREQPPRELETEQELESAREAKYREIRDAELDFRTGKLSREDYEAIDADLRAEAIDILNRLQPSDPSDHDEAAE
jgi:hypothetical protein